ncbi:MAG: DctP family TRAP transporter solute-binding subunit [Synergistales bacterium]|nr:DctP family TRAP transporter solute-binding subunit [Synergistales bacterium]
MVLVSMSTGVVASDYLIRVAHVLPESHASHIALKEEFKKQIEEGTDGNVKVELYPNAQLGGDRQAVESVSLGTLEMTMAIGSVLSAYDERAAVMDLPFLFTSREAARAALDGDFGEKLNEIFVESNMYNLGWCENGFRNITNNRGPVNVPGDLEGLKIRTMENPYHVKAFKLYGANPTPMSFGELYTALQQGTVDAQENPISIIYAAKFYEVQDYCSLTQHIYGTVALYINKPFFDSLPEEYQKVVKDAAQATKERQRAVAYRQDTELIEKLEEEGMKVNEVSDEDKLKFREAAEPLYEQYREQYGDEFIEAALQYNE